MSSPARAHFERVVAARAAASAGPGERLANASRYELMLAKLATDKRRLKQIQSIKQKIAVKTEVLPDYADYVAGVLEGGRGAQDDVLVTLMVWRIDAGDYAGALDIARYAMRHSLALPDAYERSLAGVLAEQFADAAQQVPLGHAAQQNPVEGAVLDAGTTGAVTAEQLAMVAELTDAADMHDQARAKLYKALGLAFQAQPEIALPHLRRALVLNERVGVKKDIERLEKLLNAASPVDPDAAGRT